MVISRSSSICDFRQTAVCCPFGCMGFGMRPWFTLLASVDRAVALVPNADMTSETTIIESVTFSCCLPLTPGTLTALEKSARCISVTAFWLALT